jgi:hypothetical protein
VKINNSTGTLISSVRIVDFHNVSLALGVVEEDQRRGCCLLWSYTTQF